TKAEDPAMRRILETARSVRQEKASIKGAALTPDPTDRELLESLLNNITGLDGKREVRTEIVSPSNLAGKEAVETVLAGEFLLHFGGFFEKKLRASDFATGYRSTQEWLRSVLIPELEAMGRSTSDLDQMMSHLDSRYLVSWEDSNARLMTFSRLPFSSKWKMARIAGKASASLTSHFLKGLLAKLTHRRRG
ncbi:MAG: hypothetical protein LC723_00975, partial [Actinobacteria bacterium]|nr:hypothetical protein [Actinomycetota bacterium]